MDGGGVVAGELVVSGGDAAEVLQAAKHALNAVALAVGLAIVRDGCGAAGRRRNDGLAAAFGEQARSASRRPMDPPAAEISAAAMVPSLMLPGVSRRTRGPTGLVGQGVDLGRAPAARAADGLAVVPPFAPAAERWTLMWVASIAAVP